MVKVTAKTNKQAQFNRAEPWVERVLQNLRVRREREEIEALTAAADHGAIANDGAIMVPILEQMESKYDEFRSANSRAIMAIETYDNRMMWQMKEAMGPPRRGFTPEEVSDDEDMRKTMWPTTEDEKCYEASKRLIRELSLTRVPEESLWTSDDELTWDTYWHDIEREEACSSTGLVPTPSTSTVPKPKKVLTKAKRLNRLRQL